MGGGGRGRQIFLFVFECVCVFQFFLCFSSSWTALPQDRPQISLLFYLFLLQFRSLSLLGPWGQKKKFTKFRAAHLSGLQSPTLVGPQALSGSPSELQQRIKTGASRSRPLWCGHRVGTGMLRRRADRAGGVAPMEARIDRKTVPLP